MSGITTLNTTCAAKITSNVSTHLAAHSPAASSLASDFSRNLSAWQTSLQALDGSFDRVENWLVFFSALVFVGVIVEFWDDMRELRSALKSKRTGLHFKPVLKPIAHPARAVIGGFMVAFGVFGELYEGIVAHNVETSQRIISGRIDSALEAEASVANTQADTAIDRQQRLQALNDQLTKVVKCQGGVIQKAQEKIDALTNGEDALSKQQIALAQAEVLSATKQSALEGNIARDEGGLSALGKDVDKFEDAVLPRAFIVKGSRDPKSDLTKFSNVQIFISAATDVDSTAVENGIATTIKNETGHEPTRIPFDNEDQFAGVRVTYAFAIPEPESGEAFANAMFARSPSAGAARAICRELRDDKLEGVSIEREMIDTSSKQQAPWATVVPISAVLINVGPKSKSFFERLVNKKLGYDWVNELEDRSNATTAHLEKAFGARDPCEL